jgi:molybdopterin-guanine dinucleotide biosynthesis protein A
MASRFSSISGVILAGGENRRMPVPKAFIRVGGERIIDRSIRILKGIFQEVSIVTDKPRDYVYLGVPLLGDIYNVRGPMTGILTALISSSTRRVFVMACDMPFADERLIRSLATRIKGSDAVVPVLNDMTQPLFALYSKSLIPQMESAVLGQRPSLKDFLNAKRVEYISDEEVRKIDPGARSFINLNTPEDMEIHVRHLIGSKRTSRAGSPGTPVARRFC